MTKNQSQIRAIAHLSGPMMVLAGPGSGKTSVIVERTEYLISHYKIPETAILVVTFSKAAAVEMKERFLKRHQAQNSLVTFGTFHGVFYGILKHAYGFNASNILKPVQQYQFLREIIAVHAPDMGEDKEFMEDIIREISLVKGNRISLEHYYSANCPDDAFRKIFRDYTKRCRQERLLDFDDMLVYCYELLTQREDILKGWQQKFRYILVDEFQDINQLQYDIVALLAAPDHNLFIVGDDDQSIYHFRGAKPEIMLNFKKDYPQAATVVLDVNYRSTGEILKGAARIISNNKNRYDKKLTTTNNKGNAIEIRAFENPYKEAVEIAKELAEAKSLGWDMKDIAILTRTNVEAGILVEKLLEYQIPFTVRDSLPNLYDHWITKDILAYLKMAQGNMSRGNFLAVMNRPNRYISREAVYESEVSMESLRMFYEEKEWMCDRIDLMETHLKRLRNMTPYAGVNYIRHAIGYEEYLQEYAQYRKLKVEELYEILDRIQDSARDMKDLEHWQQHMEDYIREARKQQEKNKNSREGVTVATLHSSKGLEFKQVYILNVNENMIPYKKAQLDSQIEEERRLFYVGMTRAKEELKLCYVKKQFDKDMTRSRFLEEL